MVEGNDIFFDCKIVGRHEVATLNLPAMGVKIDTLSEEQKKYLSSWQPGT